MKSRIVQACAVVSLASLGALMIPTEAEARGVRGTTRTSVNGGGGARSSTASRPQTVNRSNTNVNQNRNVNVNQNRNVNRDVNRDVSRDVDVHRDIDVDVDRGWGGYGYGYHPVARTAAAVGITAAATATAVAVGSLVNTLPPSCSTVVVEGATYQNCDGTWYVPQYSGTQVEYMVVDSPE